MYIIFGTKGEPMAQRDMYHEQVKHALTKDGWTITHDPFTLQHRRKNLYADLGAEHLISAEKGLKKIVVEIKSFLGNSTIKDLEQALGQYVLYRNVLDAVEPERILYLAVSTKVYKTVFEAGLGDMLITKGILRVLVFQVEQEVITAWIPD